MNIFSCDGDFAEEGVCANLCPPVKGYALECPTGGALSREVKGREGERRANAFGLESELKKRLVEFTSCGLLLFFRMACSGRAERHLLGGDRLDTCDKTRFGNARDTF